MRATQPWQDKQAPEPRRRYYGVYFSRDERGEDRTARLILDTENHPIDRTSVTAYSRLFPMYEARRMSYLHIGDTYSTYEEAFAAGQERA